MDNEIAAMAALQRDLVSTRELREARIREDVVDHPAATLAELGRCGVKAAG